MNNPLAELLRKLPDTVRLAVYAVVFLAALAIAAWQAADGNWLTFTVALVTALSNATAGANVQRR